jgi:hypothetical protein
LQHGRWPEILGAVGDAAGRLVEAEFLKDDALAVKKRGARACEHLPIIAVRGVGAADNGD